MPRSDNCRMLRTMALVCLVGFALAAVERPARAQFINKARPDAANPGADPSQQGVNPGQSGRPMIQFPASNFPAGTQNLSPEQVRSIMVYRALQSRGGGRGQVRTGVPQIIGFGMPGFYPYPQAMGMANQQQQQQQAAGKRVSVRERRIAARKAAEEKKRAAREAAKAKADAKKKAAAK